MEKIIIDAAGAAFGRLCSFAAKQALGGKEVIVVNSEKAIISGDKLGNIKKYSNLRKKGGHSLKGPKYSRIPYKMLKRGIRGMLPDHKAGIGKEAFKRIKCYDGFPKEFQGQEIIRVEIKKYRESIELKDLAERI